MRRSSKTFSSSQKYISVFSCAILLLLFVIFSKDGYSYNKIENQPNLKNREQNLYKSQIFTEWLQCIEKELKEDQKNPSEFWKNLGNHSSMCDRSSVLNVVTYRNKGEDKFHIHSKEKTMSSVIVTLGIGRDIEAERKLKQVLPETSRFYGADPMTENKAIFAEIGQYYPFAVGGKSGISKASVLLQGNFTYAFVDVVHIHLIYFLSQIIPNTKQYDSLWIDAEYAEYDMFHVFYKNGALDRNGLTICQFNMEVHSANSVQRLMFKEFMDQIIRDEKYMFCRVIWADGHWRMYFINMVDSGCRQKYLTI